MKLILCINVTETESVYKHCGINILRLYKRSVKQIKIFIKNRQL
jgi:hypothetical protein